MLLEESISQLRVAIGFRTSRPEGGKCSRNVVHGCGAHRGFAVQIGVQEAGIEAVACADGVDGFYAEWSDPAPCSG
jgi:hypothetical protein